MTFHLAVYCQEPMKVGSKEFELYLIELDSIAKTEHKPLDEKGKTNFPFNINNITVNNINSADGVEFLISILYLKKDKTIKYLYFTVIPYNAVGDKVKCNIRGTSEFVGSITGPINASYEDNYWTWESAWYNNTIRCIKLVKFVVEYTDGTSYTYVNEITKVLGDFKNSCDYQDQK